MDLPPDLIDLFSAFGDAGARYLLVGGHAVSAHGRPRSTKDVDLWLGPERADVERACAALRAFGAPPDIVEALRHSGPEEIVWLGRAPTRIDLLRSIPGVDFNSAWSRRITVELEGVRVPVIGKEDLIRNKLAVGRAQDLRDARHLQSTAEEAKESKGRRHKATRSRSTRKVK
jgi:predicted nucleotidyltransferase